MKRRGPFDAKWHHHEIHLWLETKGMRNRQLDANIAEAHKELSGSLHLGNVALPSYRLNDTTSWWRSVFLDRVYLSSAAEAAEPGSRMLDFAFWNLRIGVAVSDTPGGFRRHFDHHLYSFFLLLLTFRRWDQAMWLGGRLYGGNEENARRAADDKENGIQPWRDTPFGGLVLRLYLVVSGRQAPDASPPESLPDCGPYAGLFTNWYNPDALALSIVEACDYRIQGGTVDGYFEYDLREIKTEPYSVLPVEILALRNVRQRMGLDTPWPPHPLLDSPFVKNLPGELPPCQDQILLDVINAAEKVLPGFLTANPLHIQPGVVPIPEKKSTPPPEMPDGLQRTVDTSGRLWWAKQEVVIRYHIPSAAVAQRCGEELFQQMIREYPNRKRIQEIEIHVTGIPEDMVTAYQAFQQVSARNPEVEQWLLGEVSRFELDFETSEGVMVRNYEYWTEGGKRHRSEMKPAEG